MNEDRIDTYSRRPAVEIISIQMEREHLFAARPYLGRNVRDRAVPMHAIAMEGSAE